MNKMLRRLIWVCAAALAALQGACSVLPPAAPPPAVFDFGLPAPLNVLNGAKGAPSSVQTLAPPWLESTAMLYRLAYGDSGRLNSFRDSRWAAAPAALVHERLRQCLARTTAGAPSTILLVELEEFSQVFDTPTSSRAVVRLRAALLDRDTGRVLRRQSFAEVGVAASSDAPGGARALVQAADAVLGQVLSWALAIE